MRRRQLTNLSKTRVTRVVSIAKRRALDSIHIALGLRNGGNRGNRGNRGGGGLRERIWLWREKLRMIHIMKVM